MKRHMILAAAAALILSGCGASVGTAETLPPTDTTATAGTLPETADETREEYVPRSGMLRCDFFDSGSFVTWDRRAKEYPSDSAIACGVVPHHLTAGHLISGFFKAAAESRDDVETVVVVATSHYEGGDKFYTTYSDWDTPFGVLQTDTDIAGALRDSLGAATDDARMERDHSASSHIPFIKYYFPEAKAACLLVAANNDRTAPERLAKALSDVPNADKCLFLFSIDFSHYLTPAESDACDKQTREAVEARDFDRIERFGNDNVDSPVCLSAYVRLSDLLEKSIVEADNSNTLRVNETPYSPEAYSEGMTSYFVYLTK